MGISVDRHFVDLRDYHSRGCVRSKVVVPPTDSQDLVTNAGQPCLIGSSKNQRGHFVNRHFVDRPDYHSRHCVGPKTEVPSVHRLSQNSSVQYPMSHSSQFPLGALASTRTQAIVYSKFTTNVSTSTLDPRSNLMSTPVCVSEQVSALAPERRSFLRATASDPTDFVKGMPIPISTAERIR
jgi:hypothetical protein